MDQLIKEKYSGIDLFKTSILHVKNLEVDHKKILSEIIPLEYSENFKQAVSSHGLLKTGTQISVNSTKLFETIPSGQILKKEIEKHVEFCIKHYYQYVISFRTVTSWATKTFKGAIGDFHTHNNFWLSCVYYPHGTKEDKIHITFRRIMSNVFEPNVLQGNSMNSAIVDIYITEGDLLIFPAHLLHSIGYNYTNEDRYSIACNILPKGTMGRQDGSFEF
jgi:uncharacterized protein (TIGR02466 family)